MKKIILSLGVLAMVALSSCQPSAQKAEDEGALIKSRIENCTDPDSLKIYVQQARDYAQKLEQEGDDTAAKAYLDEIIPAVQVKDPSTVSIFSGLRNVADSVVNTVHSGATMAADSLKSGAEKAVDGVKDAASAAVESGKEAVEAGKDKAAEVARDTKDKAEAAKADAKKKAGDAVQKGADKLKDALTGK